MFVTALLETMTNKFIHMLCIIIKVIWVMHIQITGIMLNLVGHLSQHIWSIIEAIVPAWI